MPDLAILPYETIVEIFSNLSCPDLASMARVSRQFQLISEPLLYTSPCLGQASNTHSPESICPSFVILLRTLLTPGRDILASHVRSLRLVSDNLVADLASHYSSDTITRIVFMASKFSIREPLKSQDAHLIVLLDLLPHLEVLYITRPVIISSFSRILRSKVPADTLPCGLQSIYSSCFHIIHRVSFRTYVLFMKLPRIRIIDVPSVSGYMDSLTLDAAAASSAVTHMRFSYANMSPDVLSLVLLVPIALTHFSYTASTGCGFNIAQFMSALTPLRVSLRSLHLEFRDIVLWTRDDDNDEEFEVPHDEGSLREWPLLQTLSCSLMPLLQLYGSPRLMNLLPVSLRELEVLQSSYCWVDEEAEQLVEMLGQKQLGVPRLEKLAVVFGWGGSEVVLDKLTVACEAAGIRFVEESLCW